MSSMMMWPMGIGSLVIVGVMLALAWWAVRRADRGPMDARPMQLLDERFARGEIDAEEYQGRRQILEGAR
ncbi:MAG: SHOCT domain-containing protein [Actinomycetota bacterium]